MLNKIALSLLALALAAGVQAKDDGKNELAVCRADMEKHCRNVEPGEGRQMKCMYDLRGQLAPACATLVTEKYERFLEMKKRKEGR